MLTRIKSKRKLLYIFITVKVPTTYVSHQLTMVNGPLLYAPKPLALLENGDSQREAAKKTGVSKSKIALWDKPAPKNQHTRRHNHESGRPKNFHRPRCITPFNGGDKISMVTRLHFIPQAAAPIGQHAARVMRKVTTTILLVGFLNLAGHLSWPSAQLVTIRNLLSLFLKGMGYVVEWCLTTTSTRFSYLSPIITPTLNGDPDSGFTPSPYPSYIDDSTGSHGKKVIGLKPRRELGIHSHAHSENSPNMNPI